MELALNLVWCVLSGLLFAGVLHAGRRGRLRIPLRLALGAAALLALLLFAPISPTDDLQQSSLWAENAAVDGAARLHLALQLPSAMAEAQMVYRLLALSRWFAVVLLAAFASFALRRFVARGAGPARLEPWAVRPPPCAASVLG